MTGASNNYLGTGLTFSDINNLARRERHAVLARRLYEIDEQIEPLKEQRKQIESWLRQEMDRDEADIVDAGDFEVVRDEGSPEWQYDTEELTRLQAFLTPEQYERAIEPTVKVRKDELNKLRKLGKTVRDIIDRACTQKRKAGKIVVRRKKLVVSPPKRPGFYEVE